MSFRTSARNLFRRLLGRPLVGESPYAEIRDGYSGELREDVKSTQEPWKEVSASTYRWVRPSEVQKAMPPLEEEPTVAPKEPETDPVDEDKRPLLCEKFLVQDQLKIDYVDKSGNATRRSIRVEEVYAYDDGVYVLRAWCVLRKGYRTFVSTRIKGCREDFSNETVFDLLSRLKKRSFSDPGNVVKEILDDMESEIVIGIYSLMNYSTGKGYEKRYVSGKKKRALIKWVLKQPKAVSLLLTQTPNGRNEVDDLLEDYIEDMKVTQYRYKSAVAVMKRTRYGDRLEAKRQDLIAFVEKALQGEPAKDTAVNRLKEDLLDPSFRIGKETDDDATDRKEFKQVKKDAKKAEKRYKSKRKPEVISKQYRRYEQSGPVKNRTIAVAQRNLQKCFEDERLLFGKDDFEECVMKEVAYLFTERELQQEGEMFRKRCGAGLSTAYCSFGLFKKNRSWFTDSTGKSWLNLKTRTA